MLNQIWFYVKSVGLVTLTQIWLLLGYVVGLGLLLFFLSRFTLNCFMAVFGKESKVDFFWTGWIGVPVHELSHALFCLLFRIKITKVELYKPKSTTLGSVTYAYNPWNPLQRIGLIFVNGGPIIIGSALIALLSWWLLPQTSAVWSFHFTLPELQNYFQFSLLSSWKFWIFFYLSLCISSYMELSLEDLKGMWTGLLTLILLLFSVNAVCLYFDYSITKYIEQTSHFLMGTTSVFQFAIFVSLVNFLLSFVVLEILSLVTQRKLFNPFH